jgi:hypothetical protein
MYQEVYIQYNEAGDIIMGITPVNENIKEKNREANYMTTKTSKEKPGKTPSRPDKKAAPNTPLPETWEESRAALLALADELGFKKNNYIEKQLKNQVELLTITRIISGLFSIWH